MTDRSQPLVLMQRSLGVLVLRHTPSRPIVSRWADPSE
jgi:hypothetical protein